MNDPGWLWREGQLWSTHYGDGYAQKENPLEESQHVFIEGNQLLQRWHSPPVFHIAELGFGTGRNFLNCCRQYTGLHLIYWASELHPLPAALLAQVHANTPLQTWSERLVDAWMSMNESGLQVIWLTPRIELRLWLGDSLAGLQQTSMQVDAWFMDGFAPQRNPAMWSEALITQMSRLSHAGTTLATYSVASALRKSLTRSGFELAMRPGTGGKRQVLAGTFSTLAG